MFKRKKVNIFFRYNIYIIKITFVVTFALNCIKSEMSEKKCQGMLTVIRARRILSFQLYISTYIFLIYVSYI